MSVILCLITQTFITFNAPILEFTKILFFRTTTALNNVKYVSLAFLHCINFHSEVIISFSFHLYIIQANFFLELEFSFLPVILLSVSILNFFIFKFLQLLISTSIFTSDLTSNFNFNLQI